MQNIKPIKTDTDYDEALAEIASLMYAELGTPEGDRLDVLVTLVEAYEEKQWRIDPPDPIEAIKVQMQQRGLTRHDLARVLSSESRVSEVLNCQANLVAPDLPVGQPVVRVLKEQSVAYVHCTLLF